MSVFVGVPAVGPPTWAMLEGLMSLHVGRPWQFKKQSGYGGVHVACNNLVHSFLETDAEHFVLMANDSKVHPDTVNRLLSWDVDLVGALVFTRTPPVIPNIYMENDEGLWPPAFDLVRQWIVDHPEIIACNAPALLEPRPDDALLKVRRVGTHVLAVKRKVFEAIEPPWFKSTDDVGGGEDFYFIEQAEAAGFQPYADLSVIAGHLMGDWCIGAMDFMAWDTLTDWSTREVRFGKQKV